MRSRRPRIGSRFLALFCSLITPLAADQFGDFTYTDNGTSITITGYPTTAVGAVDIPASIVDKPVTSIGSFAFAYCSSLTSVTVPSSVTSIEIRAFYYCSGLTSVTIGNGVTNIGSYAFGACSGLTSVTIPSSVTSIGNSAFSYCNGLIAITVDPSNSDYSSIGGVLFNKIQTILIQCPGGKTGTYAIPSSVTSIGSEAFYSCSGLTSVTLPSSVTSIGDDAFYDCSGLTSVTIPSSVTSIGSSAFSHCSSLTSVTIPSSVTSIGSYAFYSCSGLTSVTIGNGVTSIGSSAFSYCSSLTSVTIPSSVTSIGSYAFYSCSGLTSVTFLGIAPTMGVSGVFVFAADGFTIYYFGSTSGFSSPTWLGYPAVDLFAPVMTVEIPSAPALVDGSSMVVFQSTTAGSTVITTFTIRNDGQQPLTGLALSKFGTHAANFTLGTLGASSLDAGASTTFDVTCTPQAGATQTATLSIASNESNENPFDILLNAKVVTINGDDFNDNLKDPAKWGTDLTFGTGGALAETNSRLEYTSTTSTGDHGIHRPWILNQATYDSDWELIMDVGNSLSWASGNRDTGIGIEIFPPGTTYDQSFFTEMNSSYWQGFGSFHGFVSGQGEDENALYDQELSSAGVIGSIRIVFNSATKVFTTYCDTDGSANGYFWTPLATFGIIGAGGVSNANWGMSGSQAFRIAVYGYVDGSLVTSGQMTADNFSIITQASGSPVSPIQSWQIAKFGSASDPEAALDFDADKDGLLNLIEYAFKLEPKVPGTPVLTTLTGTSGLPRITPVGSGPTQRLRLEYVRMKASFNPGITYVPQFSSNLQGSGTGGWTAAVGPESLQSIDTQWERVVIEDTAGTGMPNRFGRVLVTAP